MTIRIHTDNSGQALAELSLVLCMLCTFVFGIVDFGRALYDAEVMKNLVGEGSSMASRATSLATTASTVATDAGNDLKIGTQGCVIVTAVTYNGDTIQVTGQASQGGLTCTSRIGCLQGQGSCQSSGATLPSAAVTALQGEPSGSNLYVTEMFYNFQTITPTPAFLGQVIPSQLYSVAYY